MTDEFLKFILKQKEGKWNMTNFKLAILMYGVMLADKLLEGLYKGDFL